MKDLMTYLLPPALRKNLHWQMLSQGIQVIIEENVYEKCIDVLLSEDYTLDDDRENLLAYLKYMGWTLQDNFSADWNSTPASQKFVQRLLYAWTDYTRQPNGLGTSQSSKFLTYVLGLPVLVIPLYSTNYNADWDSGKQVDTLIGYDKFYYKNQTDITDTNVNTSKYWATTHVEIRLQESDLIASDVQLSTPEELLTSIYYAIAPVQNVVAAVNIVTNLYADLDIYSYGFDDIYNIASKNDTVKTIHLNSKVLSVTPATTSVDEGSNEVITVKMDGFHGNPSLLFTIDGTTNDKDFSTLLFSNNVTTSVSTDGNTYINVPRGIDNFTITVPVVADNLTEGTEHFKYTIDSISSGDINVNDTSKTPLSRVKNVSVGDRVNEGDNYVVTVTMDSTVGNPNILFTINNITTSVADFASVTANNGVTVTTVDNANNYKLNVPSGVSTFSLIITPLADKLTEGTETFTFTIDGMNPFTATNATITQVMVMDTSTALDTWTIADYNSNKLSFYGNHTPSVAIVPTVSNSVNVKFPSGIWSANANSGSVPYIVTAVQTIDKTKTYRINLTMLQGVGFMTDDFKIIFADDTISTGANLLTTGYTATIENRLVIGLQIADAKISLSGVSSTNVPAQPTKGMSSVRYIDVSFGANNTIIYKFDYGEQFVTTYKWSPQYSPTVIGVKFTVKTKPPEVLAYATITKS